MRRTISLLGAMVVVLFAVGCGPPDSEELSQQEEGLKATPILFGASCPAVSYCGEDFIKCSEWSAPTSCGGSSSCTVAQYQACVDSHGNQCINVAVSGSCN